MSETDRPTDAQVPTAPEPSPKLERRGVLVSLRKLLRTRIIAGLLMVIPIWVTWVAVKFLFDLINYLREYICI